MNESVQPQKRQLPHGWRWVRLGDVIAEAMPGFATGERDPHGVIQLRMNNVDTRGRLVWSDFIRVPADSDTVARYRLLPGDVAFNNTNSTELVGKSAVFTGLAEPVVYSNHFTRLRTRAEQLDSGYLGSWLVYEWQKRTFENLCNRWIGQSAVKNDKLLALDLPLPPLPEQKRIAAILNEQMAALERARAAAQAQVDEAKALPAAYLRQVFPAPGQALPVGWRWVRLGVVCGLNPKRPPLVRADDAPTTFVPMPAVDGRYGTIAVPEVRRYAEVKKGYTYFAEGDVLFAKITPCMQNGKHAIARGLRDGIGFGSTEFHVIRPSNEVCPEWIHFFVRQPQVLRDAMGHFTGAVGQQRVPDSYLAGLELPVAPLAEQRRITGVLIEQMAAAEKLRADLESQLREINALPAALLRRAFNGEF